MSKITLEVDSQILSSQSLYAPELPPLPLLNSYLFIPINIYFWYELCFDLKIVSFNGVVQECASRWSHLCEFPPCVLWISIRWSSIFLILVLTLSSKQSYFNDLVTEVRERKESQWLSPLHLTCIGDLLFHLLSFLVISEGKIRKFSNS